MGRWVRTAAGVAVVLCVAGTQIGGCELPDLEDLKAKVELNVQGTWTGSDFVVHCPSTSSDVVPPSSFTLTLNQDGTRVTGTFSSTHPTAGDTTGTVEGSVNGDDFVFTMSVTTPSTTITLDATGSVTGNSLQVTFTGTSGSCASVSGSATGTLQ